MTRFMKKLFLIISHYSQENTTVGVSFPVKLKTLLKRDFNTSVTSVLKNICKRMHLTLEKAYVASREH